MIRYKVFFYNLWDIANRISEYESLYDSSTEYMFCEIKDGDITIWVRPKTEEELKEQAPHEVD